nr:hypothetical protein [Tanacetum cinerariifolium]
MVNVIPPNHVDDVPVVEPDQQDDVHVVLEAVLVDEDEDPKEDEFKEEDDMEVDIEEDENELELTYPYEEMDPLNPPPHASESETEDAIEVENPIEHEDETVPASVHEVGESYTAPFLHEDSDGLLPVEKKRKSKDEFYGKLILDLGNEVRSSVEKGIAAMEKLVEKLGNAKDKIECKELKKQGLATHSLVTDIAQKNKNEAKRTKPATGMERVQEIKAEGKLPPKVYALVSTHRVAKELWEIIQMLMQGTSLTKQERECKLYDKFDKFAYKKGESLRDFYLRFSLLLNDMNIYNMKLEQFQVNMKFLNTLPPEWSKFVTDVKLVRDLHKANVDQIHAYLGQHEYHANEVRLMHERTSDLLALVVNHQMNKSPYRPNQQSYHQH